MKLSVLMTVYNEADFMAYAIKSALYFVDHIVIVEGAYQETIALGKSPRSTDGTLEIIKNFTTFQHTEGLKKAEIYHIEANEKTDKDQRNVGLEKIKELNPDGWFLIIDGDEIYTPETFQVIKNTAKIMEKNNKFATYFKSLTFVNDFQHYAEQDFPRLFKITPECKFINDNYMIWPDKNAKWDFASVMKIPYISYFHYSFCKNHERFKLKEAWWKSRFLDEQATKVLNIDEKEWNDLKKIAFTSSINSDNYLEELEKSLKQSREKLQQDLGPQHAAAAVDPRTNKIVSFDYGWNLTDGKISDPNHEICEFHGKHPKIMKDHPLYVEKKEDA